MKPDGLAGLRLLVIDDDDLVRDAIARTAIDCGIEVDEAEGGQAAAALLASNEYDVVITDLTMPDVSGLTVMERIRAHHPETALIVITGYALDDLQAHVTRCGGMLLRKPFDLACLFDALQWAKQRSAKRRSGPA